MGRPVAETEMRRGRYGAILNLTVGVAAAVLSAALFYVSNKDGAAPGVPIMTNLEAAPVDRMRYDLAALEARIEALRMLRSIEGGELRLLRSVTSGVESTESSSGAEPGDAPGLLAKQLRQLDSRLEKIESVILADPGKALRLSSLEKDLLVLKQQLDKGLASAKADSDRAYDLMKWVLGLMSVVSLSLVGTAMSHVFKRDLLKSDGVRAGDDVGGENRIVAPSDKSR